MGCGVQNRRSRLSHKCLSVSFLPETSTYWWDKDWRLDEEFIILTKSLLLYVYRYGLPISCGEFSHSPFMAEVNLTVNGTHWRCVTHNIGPLPSSFPYEVFRPITFDFWAYTDRLRDVGVPSGYIEALERLRRRQQLAEKSVDVFISYRRLNGSSLTR